MRKMEGPPGNCRDNPWHLWESYSKPAIWLKSIE
jgi:hypothetical protein